MLLRTYGNQTDYLRSSMISTIKAVQQVQCINNTFPSIPVLKDKAVTEPRVECVNETNSSS